MLIELGNFLQNNIRKIIILNNNAVALCLEGGGVQLLIAAPCRERYQEIWLLEREKLTDGIGTGTGQNNVCHGVEILQILLDIFELAIAGAGEKKVVHLVLAAKVNNLKFLQERIQIITNRFVHGGGTEGASDDHQNRLAFVEAAQCKAPLPFTLKKLVTDWRSGKNRLGIREPLHRFREVAADLGGKWNAQLVRKSGGHI